MIWKTVLLFLSFFAVYSCESLKYVPVRTPIDMQKARRESVTLQMKEDFASRNLKYESIYFDASTQVKPQSYFTLDSLFELKYKLEKSGLTDLNVENQIKTQQLIVGQDTTKSYFIEKNVFSVSDSAYFELFLADIILSPSNKIETIKILSSDEIEKGFREMYACFLCKKSFLYKFATADEAELEFYKLYGNHLDGLVGQERKDFLNFMLSVMKVANRYSSIEKEFLIKEFVRTYVQGSSRNMYGEEFTNMEEFFDARNDLVYYSIDYKCLLDKSNTNSEIQNYKVYLDPYLQLIDIKKN